MFLIIQVTLNIFAIYYGVQAGIDAERNNVLVGITDTLLFLLMANFLLIRIAKWLDRLRDWRESRKYSQVN